MKTIVIATNNQKKLNELSAILEDLNIKAISQKEAGFHIEVEENGTTFEENALLKAKAVCEATKMPALADDSGLMVTALNGEPGIYSARYAGEGATDGDRIEKLLFNMKGKENREAKFVCAIAFVLPDGRFFTVRGECFGEILFEPNGNGGFGYDPVFFVKGYNQTFAELPSEIKNKISHRGKALKEFQNKIKDFLEE
jgi:XTP/dITP diphosphohydrolase